MNYVVHWLSATLSLLATAYFVPGFDFDNFGVALVAALVIGLLNIIVWPILLVLTFPLTIITFGLFLFVLNAIILSLAHLMVPGFHIQSFGTAFIAALVLTVIGWMVRMVFGKPKSS